MSDAIRELHDYLAKSPSVIYPEDVLAYLPAIEAENAELRDYAKLMHGHIKECCDACGERGICDVDALTRLLRIEVDE